MIIKKQNDVETQVITMPGAAGVTVKLMVGREDNAPNFAMRQFTVAPDGHTPLHQHNYEHEVIILAGKGVVKEGHQTHNIEAGQVLFVPANELHQFRNIGNEPLVFMCMVPVKFDCGNGQCQPTPGA